MLLIRTFFLSVIILFLAGCATGYHEYDSVFGGYTESRIDANTYIVTFSGTRYTSALMARRYVYHRAAKLTLDAGYRYFIVTNSSSQACCTYANPSTGAVNPTFSMSIKMFRYPVGIPGLMDATTVTTISEPASYN
jgi:hypothetical protein